MERRLLAAPALIAALVATSTVVAARAVEGNPFVEPISLAGTWHYLDEDISPGEAAAADLSTWQSVQLPGQRRRDDAGAVGWYGIDVELPERPLWPEPVPELAVGSPRFLYAYEVYVGHRHIGTAGTMPPSPRWGPLRHRWFTVPPDALPDTGPLALRVRVWTDHPFLNGTGLRSRLEAILLGRTEPVRLAGELANVQIRSSNSWALLLAGFFLTLAFLFASLGLLLRQDRTYVWLTITLASAAVSELLAYGLGWFDHPQIVLRVGRIAVALGVLSLLLFLRATLGLDTKLAKGLTWAAGTQVAAWVAVGLAGAGPDVLPLGILLATSFLVTAGYGLVVSIRRAGDGQPDGRLLAWGLGSATVPIALGPWLFSLLLGSNAPRVVVTLAGWLGSIGFALLAVTMSFVVARRYARSLTELQASFAASRRFVPQRFLTLLGRAELTEVKRADATEREMAVLFADIRGFTTRSEAAGAAPTFALVNRYLEAIEPSSPRATASCGHNPPTLFQDWGFVAALRPPSTDPG